MADNVGKFEQFVKFGTDAYGLERLLRLLQALVTILLFTPLTTITTVTSTLSLPTSLLPLLTPQTLTPLRKRLASLRQPLRFFRFLDSFAGAWSALSALQSATTATTATHDDEKKLNPATGSASGSGSGGSSNWARRAAGWADFGGRAFTGMYLLLESAVFVEAVLDVPGLRVWGSEEVVRGLVVDGQRFWFAGLVCGIVGAVVRLVSWAEGEKGGRGKVVRRLVADVMDLAVPGSVVGWVPLEPRTVGWLMVGSTVLTGMEVWERCGRDVAVAKMAVGDRR
ncbi:uncharacterized protein B0H64DRAFT_467955 [Chaetomium fimeti]|uniref:Uncharacterized protein n=1 Tax=Chaetomium fimeti TaxID=1854472 RepID=A0AAE0HA46_9PEZI|nr:hypothetical protein B0H64DRAFT_467955 [Chaetomium fimeti]